MLEAPSARSAALGEALSAGTDDIVAFSYNPGSLPTLNRGHASFLFHRGINDDFYSQFLIGRPVGRSGIGLSVGYYDGGDVEVPDGASVRTVNAQRDLVLSAGAGRRFGRFSAGLAAKYFSSELAETDKAAAVAGDAGVNYQLTSRVHLGAGVQNIGTPLKYSESEEPLPRIARLGAAVSISPLGTKSLLLLDAPYYMNQEKFFPAVGFETVLGPLALRAGYKTILDDELISLGAGFQIGATDLSYAFDLANELSSRHRISVGLRFGDDK